MPDEAITAVAGLVASFLSGLLGIGGGLVLTPLLLYVPPLVGGAPIPVKIITGLTIAQAISGSVLGTIRHRAYGNVSLALVWLMGPVSAIASLAAALAALVGKAATAQIDPPLAAIVFVAALVASPVGAAVSVRTQPHVLLWTLSAIVGLTALRIAVTALTGS